LGKVCHINGVVLTWPEGKPMSNYYIFFSRKPFSNNTISGVLNEPGVSKLHIASQMANSTFYNLDTIHAEYVRIQLNHPGDIQLIEVGIPGFAENCSNGVDDDCDNLVDCDDLYDCGGVMNAAGNVYKNPSCPNCNNGEIHIWGMTFNKTWLNFAVGYIYNKTDYSINGGQTWQNSRHFLGLSPGSYNLMLRNPVTGCTYTNSTNPVLLKAPVGNPIANCDNGDFEEGTFNHWVGQTGTLQTGFTNTGIVSTRQNILSAINDQYAPQLAVDPCIGNTYVCQLGNHTVFGLGSGVSEEEKLLYEMVVDPSNANFKFYYAPVLNDGGHPANQNPFFNYRAFYVEPNGTEIIIGQKKIVANKSDPFFQVGPKTNCDGPVLFRDWTCASIDLQAHIGKTVFIEFITADCSESCHFGCCYIDGLCSNIPISANIDVKPKACFNNTQILVSGEGSCGESSGKWKVCLLDNQNNPVDCIEKSFFTHAGSIDVIALLAANGKVLQENRNYSITLDVENDCGESATSERKIHVTENLSFKFKDIVACAANSSDVQIEGVIDCPLCVFSWTPADKVQNPNIALPLLAANLAGTIPLMLTGVDEDGCATSASLKVYLAGNFVTSLSRWFESDGFCKYNFKGFFDLNTNIPASLLKLKFENLTTGKVIVSKVINTAGNHYETPFIQEDKDKTGDYKLSVVFDQSLNVQEICQKSKVLNIPIDDYYFGSISSFFFPNTFGPGASNPENRIAKVIPAAPGYKAYGARLNVYDKWGNEAFKKEYHATTDIKIPDGAVRWDGFQRCNDVSKIHWCTCEEVGISWPNGVYTFWIDFENCDNSFGGGVFKGDIQLVFPTGQSNQCTWNNNCRECKLHE
jgi:hypothetical protein